MKLDPYCTKIPDISYYKMSPWYAQSKDCVSYYAFSANFICVCPLSIQTWKFSKLPFKKRYLWNNKPHFNSKYNHYVVHRKPSHQRTWERTKIALKENRVLPITSNGFSAGRWLYIYRRTRAKTLYGPFMLNSMHVCLIGLFSNSNLLAKSIRFPNRHKMDSNSDSFFFYISKKCYHFKPIFETWTW